MNMRMYGRKLAAFGVGLHVLFSVDFAQADGNSMFRADASRDLQADSLVVNAGEPSELHAPASNSAPSLQLPAVEENTPAFQHEFQRLERKSRRQLGAAIGVYAYSVLPLAVGISALINGECHPHRYTCEGKPGANGFLSSESALGVTMLSLGAATTLGVGLPLHRAAIRNRRFASTLESGLADSISRPTRRGEALQRTGRNFFIATGVIGAGAVASLLSVPFYETDQQLSSRAVIFGGLSAAALVTGLSGYGTSSRGRTLVRRGALSQPVMMSASPVILADGAGLQLWASF